ncbi:hypothetical protein M407DRAFT_29076 [Tulasnella calospora MUT 4182]|uniref:C3H1-type domain-containing protein n=1 Tax=Tulasnella calospora MUT 4182 TaxID=1051891 RepID=A0A0C3Q060_9AGAM|nr:hypothetical protein M407DRAFT_29076 [Tulasnella calospora MUT 4182]
MYGGHDLIMSSNICAAYIQTGGFCPWGYACMFLHPVLPQVGPVTNPPQSSGTSNQQTKPKKKKKTERTEETGGPKSLPANTSAHGETSKKGYKKSWTITILSAKGGPESRGGQAWTLEAGYLIRQSNDIKNMLTNQTKVNGFVKQGKSGTLFKLDGVEAHHFSLFVDALRPGRRFDFSFDDLKTIIALSSDWGFSKIQTRSMIAIQNLRPSPVDKLLLARRCRIPGWMREAYIMLAVRTPGLGTAETSGLGPTATSIIARAREEVLLHRLQALELVDSTNQDHQCESPSRACRETLCEIRLGSFAKQTKVPRQPEEQGRLVLKHVSKLGLELCDTCKSDAAIGRTISALDEEIRVARRVCDQEIGPQNSKWLENA